jgi:hypothetical protein
MEATVDTVAPGIRRYGDDQARAARRPLVRRTCSSTTTSRKAPRIADQRAQHRSDAPGEQGPADHDRGDGAELPTLPRGGVHRAGLRAEERPGGAGQRSGQRVDRDLRTVHRQAHQPGRVLVAADGQHVAAEVGPVQDQGADREEQRHDPERHRDAQQLPGAEGGEAAGLGHRGAGVGEVERQPAGHQQRGQRDQERGQPEAGDQDAVDQPGRGSDSDGGEHGRDQAGAAELDGDHAAQRGDRADRQVDAAGHDDEAHSQRDQGVLGVVGEHALHVEAGGEALAVAQRAEHDEDDEGDERALLLQDPADPAAAGRGGGGGPGAGGHGTPDALSGPGAAGTARRR